jgi:hypothetical protein
MMRRQIKAKNQARGGSNKQKGEEKEREKRGEERGKGRGAGGKRANYCSRAAQPLARLGVISVLKLQ